MRDSSRPMSNSQAYTLSSAQKEAPPFISIDMKGGALFTYELSAYSSEVGAMQAQKAGIRLRSPKPLSTRATLIQNLFSRR